MRAAAALTRGAVPRLADVLRQAAASLGRTARGASPRLRRRLLVLALALGALLALYMLWFRDSSLVRVERVTVTGVTGVDAAQERGALTHAARQMTTLHVDEGALRSALGASAAVEAIHVSADFPHGLRIEVVEKAPVAALDLDGKRVAVGSGGVLLPDVSPVPHGLPTIDVGALPSGSRLGHGRAFRLVAAAAAARSSLRARVLRLRELPGKGLVAYLRSGPQVILGAATGLRAKWAAAAAVLADPSSRGASYVDVRMPDRPVAGGLDVPPPPDQQTALPADPTQGTPPGATAVQSAAPATTATSGPTGAQGTSVAPQPSSGP